MRARLGRIQVRAQAVGGGWGDSVHDMVHALDARAAVLVGRAAARERIEVVGRERAVDGALVGGASLDAEQFATLSAIAAGGPLP